jgi:hypothetical protein
MRPYLEKTHHKKRLVEWLKEKALSSNPGTAKKICVSMSQIFQIYLKCIHYPSTFVKSDISIEELIGLVLLQIFLFIFLKDLVVSSLLTLLFDCRSMYLLYTR